MRKLKPKVIFSKQNKSVYKCDLVYLLQHTILFKKSMVKSVLTFMSVMHIKRGQIYSVLKRPLCDEFS